MLYLGEDRNDLKLSAAQRKRAAAIQISKGIASLTGYLRPSKS
jgi:hypothetical protein